MQDRRVRAKTHSDDYAYEIPFDATPWFQRASDEEVLALMRCGWGGDYPADEVARSFSYTNGGRVGHYIGRIEEMLDYCVDGDVGFECYVNEEDAIAWLRRHRPALLIHHPEPDVAVHAVAHLPRADVEALLEHEDRRIRIAAIAALGRAPEGPPRSQRRTP